MKRSYGFTLLELMVALVVVAVALLAVERTMGAAVGHAHALRSRLLAGWVAENRLNELRIQRALPVVGELAGAETQAGLTLYWRATIGPTPNPRMRRVEVQVYESSAGGQSLARLTGYLAVP